jgi:hypothetical protein
MNTQINVGGGELNLNINFPLTFNETIVSVDGSETLVDSGTQAAISGVYVENSAFDLSGGNGISNLALIPGGGAFFFQITGPEPPTPSVDTRRRVFLLKRWY